MDINADAAKVYNTMIGKDSFIEWTAVFNPNGGSYYEGSWNKGEKIHFVGINKEGKKEGMAARIEENIPNQFISIHHYGIIDGEKEITEGPLVADWAGALENYTFEKKGDGTTVTVEVDVNNDFTSYFSESWPRALDKLKQICERQ